MTGDTNLDCVHQLSLRNRGLLSSTQLSALCNQMPNLEHLSLSHNQLSSPLCLISLHALHTLNLGFNALTSLDGIASLQHLQHLYASSNRLRTLAPLQHCTQLRTLHVFRNALSSLDEVMVILHSLLSLKDLELGGNECSTDPR